MDDKLWKIRTLIFEGTEEDIMLARQWLVQLIGKANAEANLFVLNFYKDWDDDTDILIDADNYCKMKFQHFPIRFGKDYMYRVDMSVKYQGETIFETSTDYSRERVGEGWPKWDLCEKICEKLRQKGIQFYPGLFHKKTSQV